MVQKWNNSGFTKPGSSTLVSDHLSDLDDGVDTALTCDSGTTSPDSGAPSSWGANEVGRLFFDITNEAGAGDSLGGTTKRWEQTGATPTYSMRTLGLRGWFDVSPTTNILTVTGTSTSAWTDLNVSGATTSARALSARFLVEVKDNTPGAGVFVEFRKNGVTTDSNTIRVYPQVSALTMQQMVTVQLDSSQVFEYRTNASGTTSMNVACDIVGYEERV